MLKIQGKYIQSNGYHTLFIKHGDRNKVTALIVYVDDIIITGDDTEEIKCLYILDLLQETRKLECKPADTPIDPNLNLGEGKNSDQVDKSSYQRLTGRSTSGYCTFVCENLVTWRSKKQKIVARSSAESEFKALAQGICEGLWLRGLLDELRVNQSNHIKLFCDNKSAIFIARNPVQHDMTKHIEVDRHFIK
ncbi:unnamed protein product [Spirodela intermedia]|uniref:Uncharacterized protein n=1 Tax=Spirodela intermedia TaxID=51605 RepID=A0A7I8JYY7_SPIIN|nr:unnamed protein product [Spirodela intermedia]